MSRHVSGLTAEHCAVGLIASATHFGIDPLNVFDGRKAKRSTAARQAVASAIVGSVGKMPGLTLKIAHIFHLRANRLAPCEISRAGISISLQLQIITGMAAAGFDPAALSLGNETRVRALVVAKPRPARLDVAALAGRSARCARRVLEAFNAGELTLNAAREQLQQRMVGEGFSPAQVPSIRDLHQAAKALPKPQAKTEPAPQAPAPTMGDLSFDTPKVATAPEIILAGRIEAMTTQGERRARKMAEDLLTPARKPDVQYGPHTAPPLDLGDGDRKLVAACVAQGGFPRAVLVKPGVTVWADHADTPWRFRP